MLSSYNKLDKETILQKVKKILTKEQGMKFFPSIPEQVV